MFDKVNFKYADAQSELTYAPELLREAYVDIANLTSQIKEEPSKFIVYGPKGSGKTALGAHLSLMAQEDALAFTAVDDLENFEFKLLEKTGGVAGQHIGGSLSVWKLLLSLRIISLLSEDQHLITLNPDLDRFVGALRKHGLVESPSLVKLVEETSRRGFYVKIKSIISIFESEGGVNAEDTDKNTAKDPSAVADAVSMVISNLKPASGRYVFIIDGLDYTIRQGRSHVYFLIDLISAVRGVNETLHTSNIDAKIVLLVRDEILRMLPDPNLAKRMTDNGVSIQWYQNVREPDESNLIEVIYKRALLAGFEGSKRDMISAWLPKTVHSRSALLFIFDNTRHLPRDLISIFRSLQQLRKNPPFSEDDILAALRNHSEWFFDELNNSVVGLVPDSVRQALAEIFSRLGREFESSDLLKSLKERGGLNEQDALQAARDLFNTSWFGHVWMTRENTPRFEWHHRNLRSVFDSGRRCVLHAGLWKALNLT